jgi:hypothetical protein
MFPSVAFLKLEPRLCRLAGEIARFFYGQQNNARRFGNKTLIQQTRSTLGSGLTVTQPLVR